jgi:CRISPR/Cas system-associated exonuclease Cas4 (RecB family)
MTKYLAMLSDNPNEDLIIFTFFENQTGDRIKFYIVNFGGGFDLGKLKYVALNKTLYNNDYDYYKYPNTKYYEVEIEEYDEDRKSVILNVIDEIKNLTLTQLQRESKLKELFD